MTDWQDWWRRFQADASAVAKRRQFFEQRQQRLPVLRQLLDDFLRGQLTLYEFKTALHREALHRVAQGRTLFGWSGRGGQMQLHILHKTCTALGGEWLTWLEEALQRALPAPNQRDEIVTRMNEWVNFVGKVRVLGEERGIGLHSLPTPALMPYFLSVLWHLQKPDELPAYFPEDVKVLAALGLHERVEGDWGETYLRFHDTYHAIKEQIGAASLWDVGLLIWFISTHTPPKISPKLVREARAAYHERRRALPLVDALRQVQQFFAAKGFVIDLPQLINFHLCLQTKPLVLLAGISGTGKSRLVRYYAEAVNGVGEGGAPKGFRLIPVRPTWSGKEDLLGFVNFLRGGQFQPGEMLTALMQANEQTSQTYFVCLDEMNLARVEHYFSDFLSVMETAHRNADGQWTTDPLVLSESETLKLVDSNVSIPAHLPLPDNLFVIGTVNMDESTHAFSKKVLDRANSIEFTEVDLSLERLSTAPAQLDRRTSARLQSSLLAGRKYRCLQDVLKVKGWSWAEPWNQLLDAVNKVLEQADLQFGYRVRDEVLIYLAYADDLLLEAGGAVEGLALSAVEGLALSAVEGFSMETAFDFQLLQKVLPRLSGREELEPVLEGLLAYFARPETDVAQQLAAFSERTTTFEPSAWRFPKSARKVLTMHRKLRYTGIVSFWIR